MVGIEILSTESKNILCYCVYRHPNTDAQESVNYLDNLLQKLGKENIHIYLMGDFNLNLLNYESHSDTNDFINTMVSHYLLPYVSSTVIDNIFSNITDFDTKSGISSVILVTTFHKFRLLAELVLTTSLVLLQNVIFRILMKICLLMIILHLI